MITLAKFRQWFRQQKRLRELRARRMELEDFIEFVEKVEYIRTELSNMGR